MHSSASQFHESITEILSIDMIKKNVRTDKKVNRNKCLDDHVHQFSSAIGKSKGSKTRRQSYPQRRTSKVEDIAEDSETEEEVGLPQKSDGKYTF